MEQSVEGMVPVKLNDDDDVSDRITNKVYADKDTYYCQDRDNSILLVLQGMKECCL
jgi:hypothetical protein